MKHHVLSLVETDEQVQEIIRRLTSVGVSRDDISILNCRREGTDDFTGHTPKEERACSGVGGTSLLTGIGPSFIGAADPFIAAGGMMNAFDAEEAGMKDGGVSRMLVGFGLSEDAAQSYERKLVEGGILLSVHTEKKEMVTVIRSALEQAHGQEISEV
jgi:Heat induced stress protein YflT